MADVGIGMLGSGFIGEFHADGLRYVRDARVVANWGAGPERRTAFAERFGSRALDSIDAVCADPAVDLVVVSLPNHLHLEAVRSAADHGKAIACTKPLGRNADEAAEMLRLVTEAGVFHAYLENVVFNAEMIRMREMVASGAIGRLTTFRAREGHSGPHAAHFWDAELAGGGALLDMASHGAEAARAMFGKDVAVRDVFAWGDTLVHGGRTSLEDNAVMVIRFADGRRRAGSRAGSRPTATADGSSRTSSRAPCGRSSSDRPATSARRSTPTPGGSIRSRTRPTPTATTR
jgi:predicted dehydrogenase